VSIDSGDADPNLFDLKKKSSPMDRSSARPQPAGVVLEISYSSTRRVIGASVWLLTGTLAGTGGGATCGGGEMDSGAAAAGRMSGSRVGRLSGGQAAAPVR
jgi:hypothetical protein